MFEVAYASSWHQPLAFWIVGLPLLAALALPGRSERELLGWLAAMQMVSLVDAWLTSPGVSPIAGTAIAEPAAIAFVIAGDFRYFLLLGRFGAGRTLGRAVPAALGFSLVVPALSLVARRFSTNSRVLFLAYEVCFAAVCAAVRAGWLRKLPPGRGRRFAAALTDFELVQYAAWAAADAIILAGGDAGFLVRLVPNAMYYAAFVPFAWWAAPEEIPA